MKTLLTSVKKSYNLKNKINYGCKKKLEFKNSKDFKIFVKESSMLMTKPIYRHKVYSTHVYSNSNNTLKTTSIFAQINPHPQKCSGILFGRSIWRGINN